MKNLRVLFMGTPEFAVASLKCLVENGINVVGVITAPDKPQGRGKKMGASPVKEFALTQGLNILQPVKLKDPEFIKELAKLKADLQVVVAFRMLPEVVWSMPPLGTFNLHASLLPQYRGAAPINWAIINGEKETGVTTFFLKHEIDTGNIILQEKEPVFDRDNVGSLYERLMDKGANLVLKTIKAIQEKNHPVLPQMNISELKSAPKIFKETCQVNWDNEVSIINNFIRGLSPYPTAWTMLNDKTLKIFEAEKENDNTVKEKPAEILTDNKTYLKFASQNGFIHIKELQLEGKRRMTIDEFLRGFQL